MIVIDKKIEESSKTKKKRKKSRKKEKEDKERKIAKEEKERAIKIWNKSVTFYIKSTKSNLFISIYNRNTLFTDKWKRDITPYKLLKVYSSGIIGAKNRNKKIPHTLKALVKESITFSLDRGFKYVYLIFNGMNFYKEVLVENIRDIVICKDNVSHRLIIKSIIDTTRIPYIGCKIKKDKKLIRR